MPDLQEKENDWWPENSVPNARPAVRPTHPSSTTTMTLLSTPVIVLRFAMLPMALPVPQIWRHGEPFRPAPRQWCSDRGPDHRLGNPAHQAAADVGSDRTAG